MPEISIKIYFKRGGFSKGLALLQYTQWSIKVLTQLHSIKFFYDARIIKLECIAVSLRKLVFK